MKYFLLLSAAQSAVDTEKAAMQAMGMGTKVSNALMVTVIGLSVVFLGLAILIGACYLLSVVFSMKREKKEPEKKAAPAAVSVEPTSSAIPAVQSDDDEELAAVIAAVIAAMGQQAESAPKGDFVVRRVRRVSSASKWGAAGREELLSSRSF